MPRFSHCLTSHVLVSKPRLGMPPGGSASMLKTMTGLFFAIATSEALKRITSGDRTTDRNQPLTPKIISAT